MAYESGVPSSLFTSTMIVGQFLNSLCQFLVLNGKSNTHAVSLKHHPMDVKMM